MEQGIEPHRLANCFCFMQIKKQLARIKKGKSYLFDNLSPQVARRGIEHDS